MKGELTSRIGRPVTFGVPKDVVQKGGKPLQGRVVDEVWAEPEKNTARARPPVDNNDWGDYSFCAQLIEWDDGGHAIRLAYYRRRAGEDSWKFASQMTVTDAPRGIKSLCEKMLARTNWFFDEPVAGR